jgi:DNA-binding CsgD family transcriptional regulator/PAS domain-containing protein
LTSEALQAGLHPGALLIISMLAYDLSQAGIRDPGHNRVTDHSVLILFDADTDLTRGERLLKKRTKATIVRLRPAMSHHNAPVETVCVRNIDELHTWLRSSRRRPVPAKFLLALKAEFDMHRQVMAALDSMDLGFLQVLSSSQDQIFVLDREQRMVAFFGHWPKESPRRQKDLLGKRKRDIFGPDVAAVHEAAALRALNGEEAAYEWSITDKPRPVHLFTAASPLRNGDGVIVGVLLVTRNVTPLKQAQLEIERALADKTSQLLEIERGVRQIAGSFHPAPQGRSQHQTPPLLHTSAFLSSREHEVLSLLRRGVRLRSIAQMLGISIETVRRHVKAMFRKTGVHSQEALVKLFFDTGEQL